MKWLFAFILFLATNGQAQVLDALRDVSPLLKDSLSLRIKGKKQVMYTDSLRIDLPQNAFVYVEYYFWLPAKDGIRVGGWLAAEGDTVIAYANNPMFSGSIRSIATKTKAAGTYIIGAKCSEATRADIVVTILPEAYAKFNWSWDTCTRLQYLTAHAMFGFRFLPERLRTKSPFDSTREARIERRSDAIKPAYYCDFREFALDADLYAAFSTGIYDRLLTSCFPSASDGIEHGFNTEQYPGRMMRLRKDGGQLHFVGFHTRYTDMHTSTPPVVQVTVD